MNGGQSNKGYEPRIAIVIGRLDRGGTELQLLELLPRLAAQGFRLEVYTLQQGGAISAAMSAQGVAVFEGVAQRGWKSIPVMLWHLCRLMRRRRPDIVHLYLPEAYVIGSTAALIAGCRRRVMSRRSLNFYQSKYPGFATLEKILHHLTDAIVGNSQAVVQQLHGEGVPSSRLALIYNGIALRPLPSAQDRTAARAALGLAPDHIAGLTVANLKTYKGHETLMAAIAQLPAPARANLVWYCVGRDDGNKQRFATLAAQLGIGDIVRWEGEQSDISGYLDACDLAVLPSLEEGFSNALLEKMAAALPLVATDVGGNGEALGGCGLLVEAANSDALCHAIHSLVADHDRSAKGMAARLRVQQKYAFATSVDLHCELYHRILAHQQPCIPRAAQIEHPTPYE